MDYGTVIFRVHAIKRMAKRLISEADVRHVLEVGEVIEDYPEDRPYPSKLLLAWIAAKPLHVVVAEDAANRELIVITAYEPEPEKWDSSFRRRRKE